MTCRRRPADQLHVTYNPTCEPAQILSVFCTPYPNILYFPYAQVRRLPACLPASSGRRWARGMRVVTWGCDMRARPAATASAGGAQQAAWTPLGVG